MSDDEVRSVRTLGERIGYGNMMNLAEGLWVEHLKSVGIENGGGAFSVGPCRGLLVTCPCSNPRACDWCEGAGRVTKRVARAMEEIR